PVPNPQSPIPNPQSPIPNSQSPIPNPHFLKMLRVYHLFLGIISLALLAPVGIKTLLPKNSPGVEENPIPVTTTTPTSYPLTTQEIPINFAQENTWNKILGKTPTPKEWTVTPCNGESPLLCISFQGELLGTVEMEVYPLSDHPNFQKNLKDAGISANSELKSDSPEYQSKLLIALQAWVTDVNATFLESRQNTVNNQVNFSAYPPEPAPLGKLQGIRYGFVGIRAEGGVQELHISHVAFDGEALYVMTTAFAPASVTGKFDELENLAIFQPYFWAIAANLNLPL
ncbi:hypothetical protein, partial [Nodularia chucula]|uniref:hypothetical protein n=1 Tax=Nodularia chucula TaxID=3093667 RepID=UPI0039C71654